MGISAMKKRNQTIYLGATNIPMLNADIVTGISMIVLLFVKFMNLGFVTVLIPAPHHVQYPLCDTQCGFKAQTDQQIHLWGHLLDLGASPLYAFFQGHLAWNKPRSVLRLYDVITMSLDGSPSPRTKGAGVNTLSTMLYTELKRD